MMQDHDLKLLLQKGLKQFDLEPLTQTYLDYLLLLHKWNAAYNLTAVRDVPSMVDKHLLDSLHILPWLKGTRVLDVGTGPGLPGIPIAIAKPELQVVLLDANGKKVRFLHEVKRQLQLKNIEVVQFRVENYHPSHAFDTVVSRAFSSLEQMILWTKHLITEKGVWLAMKGRYPDAELKKIPQNYPVNTHIVSGGIGERCCVVIENTTKE